MSHPDYAAIVTSLLATELGVYEGRMMSSPALKFGDKVFAFYSAKFGMGFRLGRDFDFSSLPTDEWSLLSPFKTKPPMRDWVVIPDLQSQTWLEVTRTALTLMRAQRPAPHEK